MGRFGQPLRAASAAHLPLHRGGKGGGEFCTACKLSQLKFLLLYFFSKESACGTASAGNPSGRHPPPTSPYTGEARVLQISHRLKPMPLGFFFAYFLFFKKKVGQGVRRARSFAKLSPVSAENFKSSSSMVSFCFSSPEISKMILPACIMMSRLP